MAHDDPFAGKTIQADWAFDLDRKGEYTPDIAGGTTDPDLGADGEAVGKWVQKGHLIHIYVRFLFSGAGLDPGSGSYNITIPLQFPVDDSFFEFSTTAGAATHCGGGWVEDESTPGNNQLVSVHPRGTSPQGFGLRLAGTTSPVSDSVPFTWAEGDRIAIFWTYVADLT